MAVQEKQVDRSKFIEVNKKLRAELKELKTLEQTKTIQLPIELAYEAMGTNSALKCRRFKKDLEELRRKIEDIELAIEGLGRLEAGIE